MHKNKLSLGLGPGNNHVIYVNLLYGTKQCDKTHGTALHVALVANGLDYCSWVLSINLFRFMINQDASIWLILMCKSRIYTFEKTSETLKPFMLPRSKVSLSGAIDEAKLHGCLHRSGQENPSTNNTSSVIWGTVPIFYAEIVIGCPSICQETLWVVGSLWCWSSIVPPAVCSEVSFSYWWKASFVRCKIWWYFNSHILCTLEKCFVGWKGNCISTDVQRDTTHFFLHHVSSR